VNVDLYSTIHEIEFQAATILIVDDVDFNRELLKAYFEDFNFSIMEASSGGEALNLLEKQKPDLILMDIKMPGKDGYEITEIIKNNQEYKNIPVIACTASVMIEAENRIYPLFDGYLKKPINKEVLLRELKKFLSYRAKFEDKPEETPSIEIPLDNLLQPEIKSRLLIVLDIIDREIMPKWKDLYDTLIIDEVEDLVKELKKISEMHNIKFLIRYCDNLLEQIQSFNVDWIKKSLKEFPEIITKIKSIK
jgi:CheY-like chemotaxis protein